MPMMPPPGQGQPGSPFWQTGSGQPQQQTQQAQAPPQMPAPAWDPPTLQQQQTRDRPAGPRPGTPPRPTVPGGGGGAAQPPVSVYDVYDKGRNRMLEDAQRGIEGAMSSAGFSGNRYGTSAMNQAAEQFRRHSQPFEEQWTDMLYNQGQMDLNRQLDASKFGMQHQMNQQRLALENMLGTGRLGLETSRFLEENTAAKIAQLFGMGQAETGRNDALQDTALNEYNINKYGYLPMIQSFLTGAMPQQQSPVTTNQAGKPGAMDYLSTALGIWAATGFAGASDRRLKTNIKKTGKKWGPFPEYTYKFKGTGATGRGPMAQDVEKKWPDAVITLPASNYKLINLPVLNHHLQGY